MKKFCAVILCCLGVMVCSITALAGEINSVESRLLGLAADTHEKDNAYWKLKSEYYDKAVEILSRDSVDLSDEQGEMATLKFYEYVGDETYFDKVGDVEPETQPSTQPTQPSTQPTQPSTQPAQSVTQPTVEQPAVEPSEAATEAAVIKLAEESKESLAGTETQPETQEATAESLEDKESASVEESVEASEIPQETEESGGWFRDYSQAAPFKGIFRLEVIAAVVVVIALIVLAVIVLVHKNNTYKRKQ